MNEGKQDQVNQIPKGVDTCGTETGGISSSKKVIESKLFALSQQAKDLQILYAMLPSQMTYEQDKAVFNILFNYRP